VTSTVREKTGQGWWQGWHLSSESPCYAYNQDDTIEKSYQVPLMRQIYRSAEKVLSWLGKDDEETHLTFALLERWADAILSASPNLNNWPIGEQIH
jgi:Heterokaryon incompatibility protein (HET)